MSTGIRNFFMSVVGIRDYSITKNEPPGVEAKCNAFMEEGIEGPEFDDKSEDKSESVNSFTFMDAMEVNVEEDTKFSENEEKSESESVYLTVKDNSNIISEEVMKNESVGILVSDKKSEDICPPDIVINMDDEVVQQQPMPGKEEVAISVQPGMDDEINPRASLFETCCLCIAYVVDRFNLV